jgi:thioester reductase-like protein
MMQEFELTPYEDEAWDELEKRIDVIGQNGNTGLHYATYDELLAENKQLKEELLRERESDGSTSKNV